MMVIDDQGNIEGSITGGCVEGAVVTEAEEMLAAGGRPPRPSCSATASPMSWPGPSGSCAAGSCTSSSTSSTGEAAEVERAVLEAHADGRPAAVATLIDGDSAGSRLAVIDNTLIGSLRDTDLLDRNVAREAQGLLEEGKTTLRRFGADGATLGDDVRVHIRSYALPPQMWIIGAIDFSAALAPFASQIGYEVTICDARDRFARSRRFSSVASVKVGWPQDVMAEVELGPRDAVLVFTHDPKFDEPALIAALQTNAGYIGALGSRQTTADRDERLRARRRQRGRPGAHPRPLRAGHRQPHRRGDGGVGPGRDHRRSGRAGGVAAAPDQRADSRARSRRGLSSTAPDDAASRAVAAMTIQPCWNALTCSAPVMRGTDDGDEHGHADGQAHLAQHVDHGRAGGERVRRQRRGAGGHEGRQRQPHADARS